MYRGMGWEEDGGCKIMVRAAEEEVLPPFWTDSECSHRKEDDIVQTEKARKGIKWKAHRIGWNKWIRVKTLQVFFPPPFPRRVTAHFSIPCLLFRTTFLNPVACSPQPNRSQKHTAWSVGRSGITVCYPGPPHLCTVPGELPLPRRPCAQDCFQKVCMMVQRESCLPWCFFFIFAYGFLIAV